MFEDDKKEKYPAGETTIEVHAEGRNVRIHTVRDAYGNIVSVWEEPLIFGIF